MKPPPIRHPDFVQAYKALEYKMVNSIAPTADELTDLTAIIVTAKMWLGPMLYSQVELQSSKIVLDLLIKQEPDPAKKKWMQERVDELENSESHAFKALKLLAESIKN